MKNQLNERGYALLIVLFTTMLLISLSTIFIKVSLNHALQEKAVDLKNQSYVAAEMGVKLISTDLQNEINNKFNSVKVIVNKEKSRLENCNALKTVSTNCQSPAIEKVALEALKTQQIKEYNDFIKDLSTRTLTNHGLSSSRLVSKNVNYYLKSINLKTNAQTNIHQFEFVVSGRSNQSESLLKTTIEFSELIEIFDTSKAVKYTYGLNSAVRVNDVFPNPPVPSCNTLLVNISTFSKPYNCNLANGQSLSDLKDLITAKYNINDFNIFIPANIVFNCDNSCKGKDFSGLNLFVNAGDLFSKNLINLTNARLHVNGTINTEVANNLGTQVGRLLLVSRGFLAKASNGVENTSIVVLGNIDKSAPFALTGNNDKFILENTSKFCINADNFTETSLNEVKNITGTGQIHYFTSLNYNLTDITTTLQVKKHTNLQDFLKSCDVNSFPIQEGIDIPNFITKYQMPLITKVEY